MLKMPANATAADNETREKMIFASRVVRGVGWGGEEGMFTHESSEDEKRKGEKEWKKGEMKNRITPSG